MDGVQAVITVLLADADLLALAPSERIMAGVLPLGVALPAIGVISISKVDRNTLDPVGPRRVTERVQVTVLAADYPAQKAVLRAVRHAAADKIDPVVPGITGVTILTDGAGPDFMDDETSIHQGSQDFRVSYLEDR